MSPEQKFIAKLVGIAKLTRDELTEEVIEMYDVAIQPFGYERACAAIDKYVYSKRQRLTFPTPGDLLEVLQPSTTPEAEAQDSVGRIFEAISKIGPHRTKDFRAHVGELGWALIEKSGGLETLCSMQDKEIPFWRSQLTKLAHSQITRANAGLIEAPSLPQVGGDMKPLADIIKQIEEHKNDLSD